MTERMEKRHALQIALSASAIAFALGFAWPAYAATSLFWYLPLERRWIFGLQPREIAMDWYGRCGLAALLALAAFALVYAIARRLRPPSPRVLRLWAAWTATAVVLAMSLYAYQLATRHPVPAPLPAWYEPR
jgi:hypothetical protein